MESVLLKHELRSTHLPLQLWVLASY